MSKDERADIARVLDFVNAQPAPVSIGHVADALNIRYAYSLLGELAAEQRIRKVGWGLYAPLTLDARNASMAHKKRKRPTLADARSGQVASVVDDLVDAHPGTAAARIARMDRRQLELVVMHLVRSVDPRWRFTKPLPLSPDDETDRARRKIADHLAENPEAIVPTMLALGDAIKAHDPRPRLDIRDTPYTPPEQDAA